MIAELYSYSSEVLGGQILRKHELKFNKDLQQLNSRARKLLKELDTWKRYGISCEEGFYFYLEPIYGRFPEDIFDQILHKRYIVIGKELYNAWGGDKIGIMISLSSLLDDDGQMLHFIEMINFLKSSIIL